MPVSYRPESPYGPYWSAATLAMVQEVEANPDVFSSADELGGITIGDANLGEGFPNFIAMDRPRHTEQRKVVQPAFNPSEMARREAEIRSRTRDPVRFSVGGTAAAETLVRFCKHRLARPER